MSVVETATTSISDGVSPAMRQAGMNRSFWKPNLELAAAQPLLVDRRDQSPVDEERRARIMSIPDPENSHDGRRTLLQKTRVVR